MAEVVWTQPALTDLDAIAEYIALDKPELPSRWSREYSSGLPCSKTFPNSVAVPPELKSSRYRQLVEPPCRVLYRFDGVRVFILYVMRNERLLQPTLLGERAKQV